MSASSSSAAVAGVPQSLAGSGGPPIFTPPPQYEGADRDLKHVSKANLITGTKCGRTSVVQGETKQTARPICMLLTVHSSSCRWRLVSFVSGKQHRNRLRASANHLGVELLEWLRQLLRRNIIADDCFHAMANGEVSLMQGRAEQRQAGRQASE